MVASFDLLLIQNYFTINFIKIYLVYSVFYYLWINIRIPLKRLYCCGRTTKIVLHHQ